MLRRYHTHYHTLITSRCCCRCCPPPAAAAAAAAAATRSARRRRLVPVDISSSRRAPLVGPAAMRPQRRVAQRRRVRVLGRDAALVAAVACACACAAAEAAPEYRCAALAALTGWRKHPRAALRELLQSLRTAVFDARTACAACPVHAADAHQCDANGPLFPPHVGPHNNIPLPPCPPSRTPSLAGAAAAWWW